jgi:hypothetical protein
VYGAVGAIEGIKLGKSDGFLDSVGFAVGPSSPWVIGARDKTQNIQRWEIRVLPPASRLNDRTILLSFRSAKIEVKWNARGDWRWASEKLYRIDECR